MIYMTYSKFLIFKNQCSDAWRVYWGNRVNYWYFFSNLVLGLIILYFAYHIYHKLGDELLVFHYTVDFGIDSIALAKNIFFIPIISAIVFIINFTLQLLVGKEALKTDYYHLLGSATLVFNIIIILALISIYLSNFYA